MVVVVVVVMGGTVEVVGGWGVRIDLASILSSLK